MNLILGVLLVIYVVGCFVIWRERLRDLLFDREQALRWNLGHPPPWWEYLMSPFWGLIWPVVFLIVLALGPLEKEW